MLPWLKVFGVKKKRKARLLFLRGANNYYCILHLSLLFFLLNAVVVRPPFQFSANSNDDRQSESSNFYFEGIVIAARKALERVALALILH